MRIKSGKAVFWGWIFFLFGTLCAQNPGKDLLHATIVRLQGKVEIKRAGTQSWVFAKAQMALNDNDMLRTYEKSVAEVEYEGGSKCFLDENTQILLNMAKQKEHSLESRHITALFGAVFFLIRETLPKGRENRVYTPTAVVSVRGTSFGVIVDPKTGKTEVKVVKGTVLVRNILLGDENFVKGGYKTEISLNNPPSVPKAMQDEDIDLFSKWVGEELLRMEQKQEKERVAQNARVISGEVENKILFIPLTDLSGFSGPWDLSTALAALSMEKYRAIAKAELILASGAKSDVLEAGKAQKARWVIYGEIEAFELGKHAEITVEADQYREYYKADVEIQFHIADPVTGIMIRNFRVAGNTVSSDLAQNDWKNMGRFQLNSTDPVFSKSALGQALDKAMTQFAQELASNR